MTSLIDWLSSVVGAAALSTLLMGLSLLLPVVRNFVGKYVAQAVQHRFEKKIEKLRSDLRKQEEAMKAEIRANERQIAQLTDTAISLLSIRQAALDTRR